MRTLEPNDDIVELQLQIDELSWGNIKSMSHIIQYRKYISDDIVPSWCVPFDATPVMTNQFLIDYMIDNNKLVNNPASFMADINENGQDLDKIGFVSIISLEDNRHVYFYFNKNKNMVGCEPSEVKNENVSYIKYHEDEITTKLCRLIQPYLRSGKLNWDWFRKRFQVGIDWQ